MAKRNIIPVFVPHAGCPHMCVFCNQQKITGVACAVTAETVRQEILAAKQYAGSGCELAFYGGSFTAIPIEQQEALLEATVDFFADGTIDTMRVSTRPDAIDDTVLALLRRYHVETIELGCQSMDETVLQLSERGHTADAVRDAVSRIRNAGFQLILQMMTGLPGDDGPASMYTAEELIALKPDGVRIYPTVILRGTKLEQLALEGCYRPHEIEAAVPLCADLYERFLAAGIPVIRLGLNPTELLSGGEAVAGAYHPALGELVLSEMYLHRAQKALSELSLKQGEKVMLQVHPTRISVMTGQKRSNLIRLKEAFALKDLRVTAGQQALWTVSAFRQGEEMK